MKRSRKIVIAAVCTAFLVITPIVYYWRPLVPSFAWRATYEQGQAGPHDARVYRMLFRDVMFVELPDCPEATERWFAVDLGDRLVFCPNWPRRSPYLHFNHDMSLGVAADDAVKVATPWTVSWDSSAFTVTSGDQSVRVERR